MGKKMAQQSSADRRVEADIDVPIELIVGAAVEDLDLTRRPGEHDLAGLKALAP
jgi:hypothetical protein